jgi:hypothetical protein
LTPLRRLCAKPDAVPNDCTPVQTLVIEGGLAPSFAKAVRKATGIGPLSVRGPVSEVEFTIDERAVEENVTDGLRNAHGRGRHPGRPVSAWAGDAAFRRASRFRTSGPHGSGRYRGAPGDAFQGDWWPAA